jgi:CRISPR-associated protein Csm4
MKIVYLKPKSGYRTSLRSDTLWGMICWAIRDLYGVEKLEALIESYQGGNRSAVQPFYISSAFPFKQVGKSKNCYFPMPQLPVREEDYQSLKGENFEAQKEELRKLKKERKKHLIEQYLFEKIIKGEQSDNDIEDKAPHQETLAVTHNTIDRIKGSTLELKGQGQLFHVEENFLLDKDNESKNQETVGLFFLAKGDLTLLEAALRYLEHTGIGGDKGIGKGNFEITVEDFELSEPADYNAMVNLSLYTPIKTETEIWQNSKSEFLNYTITDRQGKVGGLALNKKNIWKEVVTMFKEGSSFPKVEEKTVFGENRIVKNEKDGVVPFNISHYGMAFMVKMKIQ